MKRLLDNKKTLCLDHSFKEKNYIKMVFLPLLKTAFDKQYPHEINNGFVQKDMNQSVSSTAIMPLSSDEFCAKKHSSDSDDSYNAKRTKQS